MNETLLAAFVGVPSIVALLIAAMALRRTGADADENRRRNDETDLRAEIGSLKAETIELKAEVRSLNGQISELTKQLASANLKLLRQLLKDNGKEV